MSTFEALEAAIDMLEAIAGGEVYSRAECSHRLDLLRKALADHHDQERENARRRIEIREMSALARARPRYRSTRV